MAPGALNVWSACIVGAGAAAVLGVAFVMRGPEAAYVAPPVALGQSGAGSIEELLPAPDLPEALAEIGPKPEAVAKPAPVPLAPTMTAEAMFGRVSALALLERPASVSAERPKASEPSPPEVSAPSGDIARALALRDTTLSHVIVLPPPRPAFPEVKVLPNAAASPGIVEVRPGSDAPAWSEAGLTAPGWPAFGPPSPSPAALPAGKPERPLQSGVASWYGPGFHGRKTASGERFDQNALTAAHPHLPFGTKVKVIDPKTGRSVIVRINDRGPYAHGRVIDLSKASAQALGIGGLTRVQIVRAE